jgi:hypothetical protein
MCRASANDANFVYDEPGQDLGSTTSSLHCSWTSRTWVMVVVAELCKACLLLMTVVVLVSSGVPNTTSQETQGRSQVRLPALIDLYIHPLYVLVSKILSSILNFSALIYPLYHHLSTLFTVGSTCHFI